MDEYISKHEAYTMIKDLEAAYIYPPVKEAYGTAARRIDQMPSADVQPVKHGKWKHVAVMNSKCSVCSHYFPVTEFDSRPFDINYCPNCGARMDLKDGDAE